MTMNAIPHELPTIFVWNGYRFTTKDRRPCACREGLRQVYICTTTTYIPLISHLTIPSVLCVDRCLERTLSMLHPSFE
jgi:hypothetical protein